MSAPCSLERLLERAERAELPRRRATARRLRLAEPSDSSAVLVLVAPVRRIAVARPLRRIEPWRAPAIILRLVVPSRSIAPALRLPLVAPAPARSISLRPRLVARSRAAATVPPPRLGEPFHSAAISREAA